MIRLFICLLLLLIYKPVKATPTHYSANEVTRLLARLNIDAKGLEKVKAAKSEEKAAEALLHYYRTRTTVKHPITSKARTNAPTKQEIEQADNALKHIFVGQPSYAPYFCGDDINWASSPVPDKEWVWQLNRMTFWNAMSVVYLYTGDEKYAQEWCAQLVDWVQKNPRDEAHAYAWRSIEAGIRGHSWTALFQRFLHSPSFTPAVLITFLNSFYDHAEYLMTKHTKGSNWALMEAEGMAFIALTFPEFKLSEKWLGEAASRLNKEIITQIYEDGHQRELAFGYHTGCIDWFMRSYTFAHENGKGAYFSKEYTSIVEKMCEVPMKLAFPNGQTPQFGDAWVGAPGKYYHRLREWATYFNRPDFLYVGTEGKEGIKPSSTAFALKTSGLYSMRSGWDKEAICLVLKCGPDGGGHSQPDNGTFELFAGGRHLMPDAGSYIYSGDPEGRAWFRQTAVHQTLTLDSMNTAYKPTLIHWQNADDLDVLVVENASYPQLTHRRSLFFVDKKYFIIVDDAVGSATGNVDIHFQLAPGDALYDYQRYAVRSNFNEGWNVLVQSNTKAPVELTPEKGEVSFVYTKKEPRPAFRFRQKKSNPSEHVRFVTIVAPYGKEQPVIQCKVVDTQNEGQLWLEVQYNGQTKRIGYRQ